MPAMTKRVNIRTTVAVKTVNPPISGTYKNVIMSTSDILKCLCRRAYVEEILPDGTTVKLNMNNYYLDNGAGLDAYHPVTPEKTEEKKVDLPKEEDVNAVVVSGADLDSDAPAVPVSNQETTVADTTDSDKAPADPVNNEEPVVETANETVHTSGYISVLDGSENEEVETNTTVATSSEDGTVTVTINADDVSVDTATDSETTTVTSDDVTPQNKNTSRKKYKKKTTTSTEAEATTEEQTTTAE